ncbi:MAG: formate--tetrahydrofolate ligase [Myxococcales bacterium]
MPTDLEIARSVTPRPIADVAADLGIDRGRLIPYGRDKAKIEALGSAEPRGRLVLVSAITPTPAGEGKTTVSIGLGQALGRLGKKGCVVLREPSVGPVMGIKGGGTGGGRSQVIPMDDINLHFTGDIHAVTAANNLLSAVVDNHLHHGNELDLEARSIVWKRVMDVNDRALRQVVIGLGGTTMGIPREAGFDITAASEVMAILCLANDREDLVRRLGSILVGQRRGKGGGVFARDLEVAGAMAVLLKDAVHPNLVQTLEGTPAIVHGGPFANIAQGTNSVIATRTALSLADYVVTEAGFAFDLGGEKFLDIKCVSAGLQPSCVVLVATARALKMHGGVGKEALGTTDVEAVMRGIPNLEKHIDSVRAFGLVPVVAINRHAADADEELRAIVDWCATQDVRAAVSRGWELGGAGVEELARVVVETVDRVRPGFTPLYRWEEPIKAKIETIATRIYGAGGVTYTAQATRMLSQIESLGLAGLPICMAKTQNSLSDDPRKAGRPRGFELTVREVTIAAGAGFIVPITGDMMRMPGLPKVPASARMRLEPDGTVVGLR